MDAHRGLTFVAAGHDREATAGGGSVVDAPHAAADRRGLPPARVALAWMLGKPAVTAPIVGVLRRLNVHYAGWRNSNGGRALLAASYAMFVFQMIACLACLLTPLVWVRADLIGEGWRAALLSLGSRITGSSPAHDTPDSDHQTMRGPRQRHGVTSPARCPLG